MKKKNKNIPAYLAYVYVMYFGILFRFHNMFYIRYEFPNVDWFYNEKCNFKISFWTTLIRLAIVNLFVLPKISLTNSSKTQFFFYIICKSIILHLCKFSSTQNNFPNTIIYHCSKYYSKNYHINKIIEDLRWWIT